MMQYTDNEAALIRRPDLELISFSLLWMHP